MNESKKMLIKKETDREIYEEILFRKCPDCYTYIDRAYLELQQLLQVEKTNRKEDAEKAAQILEQLERHACSIGSIDYKSVHTNLEHFKAIAEGK